MVEALPKWEKETLRLLQVTMEFDLTHAVNCNCIYMNLYQFLSL